MVKKLKIKFVALAAAALFILMTVLVCGMNLLNYNSVVSEADMTLETVLSGVDDGFFFWGDLFLPHMMSPEVPYESRYFYVLTDMNGNILKVDTSRIVSVSRKEAEEYFTQSLQKKDERGFVGNFRYLRASNGAIMLTFFLDCGRRFDAFYRFLYISAVLALVCWLIVSVAFIFISGRIIRPIAESYEKQKRFITDAGHEIKTPLTIISANADLLEADIGENENVSDIKQQTKRLASLTQDLVYLSRMEEGDRRRTVKVEFPISDLISEEAAQFKAPALLEDRMFLCSVEEGLTAEGSPDDIRRLISILLENAMKYTPRGGEIRLDFLRWGRILKLTVFNTTAEEIEKESLAHVFDRFYRADKSRSTSGQGIGLSVAHAIVQAHGGKISASTDGGRDFKITVSLPCAPIRSELQ